ncbi:hypothetical protein ECTW09098_4758, partial [Escherichia coli TW09098]
MALEQRK